MIRPVPVFLILAVLVAPAFTPSAGAKTVLPMADRDACLGWNAPKPEMTQAQRENLENRSKHPRGWTGWTQMVQRKYSILLEEFYIAQCNLRRRGKPYNRQCPRQLISMQDAMDQLSPAAFTISKAEFQGILRDLRKKLKETRSITDRACAQ